MARHRAPLFWRRIGRWRRDPRFLAVLAAVLLVGGSSLYWGLSAVTVVPPPSSPSPSPPSSGQPASTAPAQHPASPRPPVWAPWQSGVSYPDAPGLTAAAQARAAQAFGSWRGSAVGVAVAWPLRATWAEFTQPSSFYTTWARQPYTKSFGIPLFPEDVGATVEGCIAGSYDDQWRTFAQTMNSTGLAAQGTIIRLGWEFNNQSPQWGSPSQFAACFRQIQSTVSAIAPGLVWDWNVNRGPSSEMPGSSVLDAYPGDKYVNLIGVDSYDDWPPANTRGGWQTQLNGPYGLNYWLGFAKAHGKLLSVPEWGVASGGLWPGHEGGDDPGYIKDMYGFFAANQKSIAYESYFDDTGTSIYNPVQNPQASAEYIQLWRSGPPGLGRVMQPG